ncbi:MAG: hypothetical protein R3F56_15680 [Planctomycetota bacterium]
MTPHEPTIAQIRLIVFALAAGLVIFGGVLLVLAQNEALPMAETSGGAMETLGWVAVLVAATSVVLAFVVRGAVWRGAVGGRRDGEAPSPRARYAQGALVFAALLEGGALLNLVAVMLVPSPWVNVGAAGVLLALMLATLPSEEQFDNLQV